MKAADFRIGWRLLLQERAYSAVSIIGLAVGFAACFLLLAYVRFCFSYDSEVPRAEQVYAAKMKLNILGSGGWYQQTPLPLLAVAENSGLAEAAAVAIPLRTTLRQGATISNLEVMLASDGLPKVLGLRALEGDLQAALARPDAVVLTRGAALALLGSASGALGKTLQLDSGNYQVAAILPDPPVTSSLQYRAMAGIGTRLVPDGMRAMVAQAWGEAATFLYLRLPQHAGPDAMLRCLQDALDASPVGTKMAADLRQQLQGRKPIEIALTQLPDLYFDRDLLNRPGGTAHGDVALVLSVAAIAVLILVLAATNYVNLATVRTMRRQGEIAMRKMLGAGPGRVAGMFLAESLLVALAATAGGMLLAWMLLPACAALLDRPLAAMMTADAVLAALAIGTATGLLAGLYPAWVALRVRPARTLTGRGSQETQGTLWLRRCVSVLQITAAMGLTAATLAVAWQSHFAGQADPGFDPAPLLVLEMPAQMWQGEGPRSLRDALLRLKGVQGAATSPEPVGRTFHGMHGDVHRPGGPVALLQDRAVSPNFFQVHGVQALAGRVFDPQREQESNFNSVMLNAAAAKALGFATAQEAVGQKLSFQGPEGMVQPTIVGIAPDLRYQSLREQPQPILYRNSLDAATLTVRYGGDMAELERAADALWRQYMPDSVPAMRRASDYFAVNYADDARLAILLAAASSVAMLLSAFGIYVLSAYNVQRRAREIVLRKLNGAGHGAIARLLGKEFAWMLGAAALLGLPLAAFAIERYLASFVERAPIGPWALLAALAAALLVALGATVRHTLAALRMAPALALRN